MSECIGDGCNHPDHKDDKVKELISTGMKQLETQQESASEKTELDEYEQSAAMFHMLSKQFRKIGYRLAERKKKAPIRVLEVLLFAPLEDVKVLGAEEEKLVDLCNQILYHKMKINEYVLNKSMKQKENDSAEKT